MTLITVDARERGSNVPSLLDELGVKVEIRHLDVGDYVCGPQTIVEGKTVPDLHLTIINGRLWRQLGQLRGSSRSPCLLIEGPNLFSGRVPSDAIRGGCLAASDLGISVIRTEDAFDTARWLYRIAKRRQEGRIRDRPVYAQRPQRRRDESLAEKALAVIPGMSTQVARALLERYGTLGALAVADPSSWENVPGVGPVRAAALRVLIHEQWSSPNPL